MEEQDCQLRDHYAIVGFLEILPLWWWRLLIRAPVGLLRVRLLLIRHFSFLSSPVLCSS